MVTFNSVQKDDPNCFRTAASGKYPSLFLGKAADFKSEKFPQNLAQLFTSLNTELEAMPTCNSTDVVYEMGKSGKMFEEANNEMVRQTKQQTMSADAFSDLDLQHKTASSLNQYYRKLNYPEQPNPYYKTLRGGSFRRKSRRKTLKRKRRTRAR
jgi:hypothetical protein